MNPAIEYERARERQAMLLKDPRGERLARRVHDPRRPALAAQLRDALLNREPGPSVPRAAAEPG
jgi:hypothetical protein